MNHATSYSFLEPQICAWAKEQVDILAVFVVGSRGRSFESVLDAETDLDVLLISMDVEKYRNFDFHFVPHISNINLAVHQPSCHMIFQNSIDFSVIFSPNLDVDFSFISKAKFYSWLNALKLHKYINAGIDANYVNMTIAQTFKYGFRTLLDKANFEVEIKNITKSLYLKHQNVTEDEFIRLLDSFLLLAHKSAKKAQADNLFAAKWICDVSMRLTLIQLLKWHINMTRSFNEGLPSTRDIFVDTWADRRAWKEISTTISTYKKVEIFRSILATINTVYWIGAEIAINLKFEKTFEREIDKFEWIKSNIENNLQEELT